MLRNPSTNSDGTPELNEEEKILFSSDLCSIEFGELTGDGSFYISTQRIIWLSTPPLNNNNTTSYSFSTQLIYLMVHALCKETDEPFLFLQVENQENDIKIQHKSYDKLQECYEALCEGQRLNPCQGDSSDGGDAFMSMMSGHREGDNEEKEKEKVQNNNESITEQQKMELLKQWESKLQSNTNDNVVNNRGYLEAAVDGQFDDVEKAGKGMEGNEKIVIGINSSNSNSNSNGKVEMSSFDPFHFAENIFDSKPPTASLSGGDIDSIVKEVDLNNKNNPYLDDEIMKGMLDLHTTEPTFEKKYKAYSDIDANVKSQNKMENDEKLSQQ